MQTATVRDLRNNFSKLEMWLADGQEIQIQKKGKPVGVLRPSEANRKRPCDIDWAGRRRAIFGDRCFSEQEVKEMRDAEFEGGDKW